MGTSGLFGTRERFLKSNLVYDALGMLDELNSLLGICRARAGEQKGGKIDMAGEVVSAQKCLFIIQAELAGAPKTICQSHIDALEHTIESIEGSVENPHAFIIPGATELSALLDYARAVCRRAERAVISADRERPVSPATNIYLNRLSSLLYALARYTAKWAGTDELSPEY